jgi:hypothetical protein
MSNFEDIQSNTPADEATLGQQLYQFFTTRGFTIRELGVSQRYERSRGVDTFYVDVRCEPRLDYQSFASSTPKA